VRSTGGTGTTHGVIKHHMKCVCEQLSQTRLWSPTAIAVSSERVPRVWAARRWRSESEASSGLHASLIECVRFG
jgi:hypothetical protein